MKRRNRFSVALSITCAILARCPAVRAESFTTNIVSGVSSNAGATLIVGNTGSFNYFEITSGGSVTNQQGIIGNGSSASNNAALARIIHESGDLANDFACDRSSMGKPEPAAPFWTRDFTGKTSAAAPLASSHTLVA